MLEQALKYFNSTYEKKGDALILDNYIPSDGTYVIVTPFDEDFEIIDKVEIKQDKKTKEIDRSNKYLDFICMADYYSGLIDMNKPIDVKKIIHSNNYLSFFVKKESFASNKLKDEIIENYYNVLRNPRLKYSKPKAKALYNLVEEEIGAVDEEKLIKIEKWIKENIFELGNSVTGKDYLKVFFYYDEKEFEQEGKRYLITNIYNNNDFNEIVDGDVYGLPNNNMGLNAKKPYLENKTRKVKVPYLINQNQVLSQKKFFDYLMNQVCMGKYTIYMNQDEIIPLISNELPDKEFKGIYFRIKKGKEVEIHDFDVISKYNPKLIKEFEYVNVLDADYTVLKQSYEGIHTLKDMNQLINDVLFSKMLISNYFTDAKDISIKDQKIKQNILFARDTLIDWFYKDRWINVWKVLDRVSLELLKHAIECGYSIRAINQFNLRMSLKNYFEGGEDMADTIKTLKENLKVKIKSEDTLYIENDREYLFAVGQMAAYLLSKSKTKKQTLSMINPFLNAKKNEIIKDKLKGLFKQYNYDIVNYREPKNLYAMIAGYEIEGKIDEDMIIAGYLHSNILYEKREENKGGKNDGK